MIDPASGILRIGQNEMKEVLGAQFILKSMLQHSQNVKKKSAL